MPDSNPENQGETPEEEQNPLTGSDSKTKGISSEEINRYATTKTVAQGLLDIALLTANASQLKYLLHTSEEQPFYVLMLTLISLSIILQVTSGISMIWIGTFNVRTTKHPRRVILLNNCITAQIFVTTVINILISSFGLEHSLPPKANPVQAQRIETETT